FEAVQKPKVEKLSYEQLLDILDQFGENKLKTVEDIFIEAASKLPKYSDKHNFVNTLEDNETRIFNYGCDYLVKRFEEEFENAF
ncbi:MAG: hypothetical protein GY756_02795, partial [bacterium]|nr:hypothetical protein [bacterium]